MRRLRILVLALGASLSALPYVAATPVTWEAFETVSNVYDPFFHLLSGISVGTPWTLDFTLDPGAPGILHGIRPPSSPPTNFWRNS